VTGPVRAKASVRYTKSLKKLGEPLSSRAAVCVRKFQKSPDLPGLNFEPYKGRPGFFTIRVELNFRILLKEAWDEDGPYYLLADIGDHDSIY